MNKTIELETDRLLLRKFKLEDYIDVYNTWTSDDEVCKYVIWDKHENSIITKKLIEYWLDEYKKEYTYRWVVELKDTKKIVGMIDVIDINVGFKTAEIGYCYGSKYWGMGYATEALTKVIDYLHNDGFITVYAEHFKSNIASGKVMQKAGMVYEATLQSRVINKEGKREDLLVYTSVKE